MRFFVTHMVPKEICSRLPVSEASNIFSWNLIEGNCFDRTIALVPVNVYDPLPLENTHRVKYLQSRFFGHRLFGRILNNIVDSFKIIHEIKSTDTVWFYNLVWTQLLAYIILFLFGRKIFVIVADHTPSHRKLSIASISKCLIEHSRGIITLSSRSEFQHHNMKSIAGVISLDEVEKKSRIYNPRNNKFLFSGGLEPIHGIDLAIEVFTKVPEAILYVTGKKLNRDIEAYNNIKFLGYLSREEYEKLMNEVSCCLSFRNPAFPENQNNFPSKIIEYMVHNKYVISTMKYPELKGLSYIYVDYDCNSVCGVIRDCISHTPYNEYQKESLVKSFSPKRWSDTMMDLESKQ